MDINAWFENGCNYQKGVTLYASLKGHSLNLLRLFLRKQSISNADKLKYELGKHRKSPKTKIVTPAIKEKPQKLKIDPQVDFIKVDPKTANSKNGSFYSLNKLHIDLHPLAIKQRNDFQIAISLHSQLTRLHVDEEGAALTLCIKIEDLFDAIETAQKVLDHYVTHKIVLNIESRNFKALSPALLIQSRNNKRISLSKYKKKVETLKLQLGQNLSKAAKNKNAVALEKAENKLLHHELELQQLNELINANE
jgi:hypothetical protein